MKKAIVIIGILILVIAGVFFLNACDKEEVLEVITINTPYCDLSVPVSFENNVTHEVISEDPYTLKFEASEDGADLFTLFFDQEAETLIGTLVLDDKNIVLYAEFASLDKDGKNYEKYSGYQDGINTIINGLTNDYEFVIDEVVGNEKEDILTFTISTEIAELQYPSKWESKVEITEEEDCVKFSVEGYKLFDVYFTECDGYLLGTYNKTPIYIISYAIDDSELTQSEYDTYCKMQDDVNVIIDNLLEDKKFKVNE